MRFAELLIQYNGFLLIFSATGFLISLIWFSLTEKSNRKTLRNKKLKKDEHFDEKVFFNDFENLENPAVNDFGDESDLKPIFEKKLDLNKMNDMPKFPILKKEINDTLKAESKKEAQSKKKTFLKPKIKDEESEKKVQGLLSQIKKDIKNKKG